MTVLERYLSLMICIWLSGCRIHNGDLNSDPLEWRSGEQVAGEQAAGEQGAGESNGGSGALSCLSDIDCPSGYTCQLRGGLCVSQRPLTCPTAQVKEPEVQMLPFDVIFLDGSGSTSGSEGSRIIRYEWTVITRPEGSTSQVVERFFNLERPSAGGDPDLSSTPEAFLFLDHVGLYEVMLTVTDNAAYFSPSEPCPQSSGAILSIEVKGGSGLQVYLTWDTPNDPDQSDNEGTDADLHLLHPQGLAWRSDPWDCFYMNTQPDWGLRGPDQNPTLSIDDTNGLGPEAIIYPNPEPAQERPYQVGIDYYSDGLLRFGASLMTAEIYVNDELRIRDTQSIEPKEFWIPFEIYWSEFNEAEIILVNRFYPSIDEAFP